MVGMGASVLTGAIAVVVFGAAAASAPVIVCALLAGIAAQFIWNAAHMPDKTDNLRREYIGS
jgi:hypothetical protein